MNKSLLFVFLCFFSHKILAQSILISEINYKSEYSRDAGDWLEIHNYGSSAVDISNWTVIDATVPTVPFTIPSGTSIAANGYLVFYNDLTKFNAEHAGVTNILGPLPFALSKTGETLALRNAAGTTVTSVYYMDTLAWPRAAKGYGTTLEYDSPSNATYQNDGAHWFDGCIGGSPGAAYSNCSYQIIFSEINYNSDSLQDQGEYIELFNTTSSSINLTGYALRDSRDTITNIWYFPSGTILAANGRLVVSNAKDSLLSYHPGVSNVLGNLPFSFSNTGEALRLYNGSGKLIHTVRYNDATPWPVGGVDGGGYTLEANLTATNFNKGTSWFQGCMLGTPGVAYATPCETGIEENHFFYTELYPNPTSQYLSIQSQATRIVIYDFIGKKIWDNTMDKNLVINTEEWAAGLYTVILSDDQHVESHKILKQ